MAARYADAAVAAAEPARELEARAFDDPFGEAARRQTESLEHDARMRAAADGDAPMIDLLDELASDEAAVATMRACLAPPGAGA